MKKKLIPALLMIALLSTITPFAAASAGTFYETESNNILSTADYTADDYDNYGKISSASDVDWWYVYFSTSGKVNFWLGNIPSGCDYDLRVYSPSEVMLAQSKKSGSADELITLNVRAGSTYYIRIIGYNGSYNSSYYLMRTKWYSSSAKPWYNQPVPMWEQEDYNTCGAANMRMVLNYYGVVKDEDDIIDKANYYADSTIGCQYDCYHYKVLNFFLAYYGINTQYAFRTNTNMSQSTYKSKLQNNINQGYPFITIVVFSNSPHFPIGTSSGHFVTVRGYRPNSSDSTNPTIIVNDSTQGNLDNVELPLDDFYDYVLGTTNIIQSTTVVW